MEQVLSEGVREQEEVWVEAAVEAEWAATVRAQVPAAIVCVLNATYLFRIR